MLAHVHSLLNPGQGYNFDRYGFLPHVHRYIWGHVMSKFTKADSLAGIQKLLQSQLDLGLLQDSWHEGCCQRGQDRAFNSALYGL